MSEESKEELRLIRMPEVKRLTGCSRTFIYNQVKEGLFPKPAPLGCRTVAWVESEVKEWILERMRKRC